MIKAAFWVGGFLVGLGLGMTVGYNFHPYESCESMYETPEDISECVWIKENP